MKARIPHTLAVLLLAGAAPLAYSQSGSQPPASLADAPVASVARSDDMANSIAQALSADASLKNSKITVQLDDNAVLLTGATSTDAQRRKAGQIATSQAGEGKVVNAIMTDEIVLYAPPPQESLELPAAEPSPEGVLPGTSS